MTDLYFDFVSCEHVNYLWSSMVERLGLSKSQTAVRQALDLQSMQGNKNTLPVLLLETCGVALTNIQTLYKSTGLSFFEKDTLVLLSTKSMSFQILHEARI